MRTQSVNTKSITRLMLANDKPVERIGMHKLLERYFEPDTIQEDVPTQDIIDWVKRKRYDLIIVDSSYPNGQKGNILSLLRELKRMKNSTPVIVMGNHDERQYALNAYMAGVTGFVDKSCTTDEFLRAVGSVLNGKKYVSPTMDEYLAEQVAGGYTKNPDKPLHETLSWREFQVMMCMAQGLTQTEIAHKLNIHRKTVYTYKTRIFDKMHLENLTQLITHALLHGLISPEVKPDDYHKKRDVVYGRTNTVDA